MIGLWLTKATKAGNRLPADGVKAMQAYRIEKLEAVAAAAREVFEASKQ